MKKIAMISILTGFFSLNTFAQNDGYERCRNGAGPMPSVNLAQHEDSSCRFLSGKYVGKFVNQFGRTVKKVVYFRSGKPNGVMIYDLCDNDFSCRGSNSDDNVPPSDWYDFTGNGQEIGWNPYPAPGPRQSNITVCQASSVDFMLLAKEHDASSLGVRFRLNFLPSGDIHYQICGGDEVILKKQ